MAERSPARKRFLEFLVSVAALHIASMALYYGLDMAHSPAARQRMFAWTWRGTTVLVVVVGLQRLKRARRDARRSASLSDDAHRG